MIRHKWKDGECIKCGLHRDVQEQAVVSHKHSIENGVETATIYDSYCYSYDYENWTFERPECISQINTNTPSCP